MLDPATSYTPGPFEMISMPSPHRISHTHRHTHTHTHTHTHICSFKGYFAFLAAVRSLPLRDVSGVAERIRPLVDKRAQMITDSDVLTRSGRTNFKHDGYTASMLHRQHLFSTQAGCSLMLGKMPELTACLFTPLVLRRGGPSRTMSPRRRPSRRGSRAQ